MKSKFTSLYIYIIIPALIFIGCAKKNYELLPSYQFKSTNNLPDYNNLDYWAAHPWKWDPSDSVPKPLRNNLNKDSSIDVFFLHPTSYTGQDKKNWNADIDNQSLNINTDYSSILYQASVFNEHARVFAPRYRQAHINTYYTTDTINKILAFETAYQDIKNAFENYLKNYNNNRPIIIASHSQGTTHAGRLLKEFFENKPLKEKLICAYIIGMPIPVTYFDSLVPCKDENQIGCFVGWRTYKRGYIDPYILRDENYKSYVVNPLNWKMENGKIVSKDFDKGAILKNFNKLKKHILDAEIKDNVLWTCKPKFFGNFLIRNKNYHIGDINLFYKNIRDNITTRLEVYNSRLKIKD